MGTSHTARHTWHPIWGAAASKPRWDTCGPASFQPVFYLQPVFIQGTVHVHAAQIIRRPASPGPILVCFPVLQVVTSDAATNKTKTISHMCEAPLISGILPLAAFGPGVICGMPAHPQQLLRRNTLCLSRCLLYGAMGSTSQGPVPLSKRPAKDSETEDSECHCREHETGMLSAQCKACIRDANRGVCEQYQPSGHQHQVAP